MQNTKPHSQQNYIQDVIYPFSRWDSTYREIPRQILKRNHDEKKVIQTVPPSQGPFSVSPLLSNPLEKWKSEAGCAMAYVLRKFGQISLTQTYSKQKHWPFMSDIRWSRIDDERIIEDENEENQKSEINKFDLGSSKENEDYIKDK